MEHFTEMKKESLFWISISIETFITAVWKMPFIRKIGSQFILLIFHNRSLAFSGTPPPFTPCYVDINKLILETPYSIYWCHFSLTERYITVSLNWECLGRKLSAILEWIFNQTCCKSSSNGNNKILVSSPAFFCPLIHGWWQRETGEGCFTVVFALGRRSLRGVLIKLQLTHRKHCVNIVNNELR